MLAANAPDRSFRHDLLPRRFEDDSKTGAAAPAMTMWNRN
jgi:hypothetical protein